MRLFLASCLLLLIQGPLHAQAKLPSPSAEALRRSGELVRSVYAGDFAKTTPAARLSLANKLLEQGIALKDVPADRFVLWIESARLALLAGDVPLAWKALGQIDKQFAVSVWELKANALEAAKANAGDADKLAKTSLSTFEDAIAVDLESASRLLTSALSSARQAKNSALVVKIQARQKEFATIAKELDKGKEALDVLKANPKDPAANANAGRFLCFVRGEWSGGLPLLARGNDAGLRTLATKDLARPKDVAGRVELGDGWFGQSNSLTGLAKTNVLARACAWYREAGPLTGFTKVRVDNRLADLAAVPVVAIEAASDSAGEPAQWTVLFRSSDPAIWKTDVRRGPDDFAVALDKAPENLRYVRLTNRATGEYAIVETTRALLGERNPGGRFRWIGSAEYKWKACHLGVVDMNYVIYDFSFKGTIVVDVVTDKLNPFPAGRAGWGFGHRTFADDIQGFCWGPGGTMPTAVFEIAVTGDALSPAEAKFFFTDDLVALAKAGRIAALPDDGDWLVVFRSSDPAHWGFEDRNAADHLALDLRKVPEGVRYVKLTNTTTKDFVIAETTKATLIAAPDEGRRVWRGDGILQKKARHLGICDRQTTVKAGEFSIAAGTISGHGGWGFGHPTGRDGQSQVWAGRELPLTVFEIALKSSTLTPAEEANLLTK